MKRSRIKTLRTLRMRCSIERPGDPGCCWIWKGAAKAKGGRAVVWIMDKTGKAMAVGGARAAAILKGKDLTGKPRSWQTCGNPLCCQPNHEMSGTYAEWGAWKREHQQWPVTARMLAAAAARGRRRSKINLEIARQIRASTLPAIPEGQRWGVSHDVVLDARAGKLWPEPNPFAGLGA